MLAQFELVLPLTSFRPTHVSRHISAYATMSLAQQALSPALQTYLTTNNTCPSLDEWLTKELSTEHKRMYGTLLQARLDTKGDAFPVDFDTLWPTVGYSRKDPANRLIVSICV